MKSEAIMGNTIKRILLTQTLLVFALSLFPFQSNADLIVREEVASGNIVQKNDDRSIKLDDGNLYYPSRKGLAVNLAAGEPVTLKYYVEVGKKNIFYEYAPGLKSLRKNVMETEPTDRSPK